MFNSKSKVSTAQLIARDGWCCSYCGEFLALDTMTVDHILPTSRGGADTPENTVISCLACNASKGDMTAIEYNHWLVVKRYVFEIAPSEPSAFTPIEIKTRGGAKSVIALPCVWGGWAELPKHAKEAWEKCGGRVIALRPNPYKTHIVALSGTLYDYFNCREWRKPD